MEHNLQPGEKVIFIPDGTIYDFGYVGKTGRYIVYKQGERNMQDSHAIEPKFIERVSTKNARMQLIAERRGLDYPGITICYICHDGHGNYLMNKRSTQCHDEHGCWDFGGGRVEYGDGIDKTVRKELREEYCVSPRSMEFLGYHDLFRKNNRGRTHWLCMIFLIEVDRTSIQNGEPHKFDAIEWFTLDNLPTPLHPLAPIEVKLVKNYLHEKNLS